MVSLDKSVVARYEKHGERFEIFVDPEVLEKSAAINTENVADYMATEEIFKDAHKGERASREALIHVFGTDNIYTVAVEILKKGEIQLTTEQRRKMIDEKKKKIITYISRNAINPQTKTPHPPQRIEMAMEEAKVHIDPFKPVDQQINTIVKALQTILPLKFEKILIAIKVRGEDYGKVYSEIRGMATITREEWQRDGSWIALVELPAGMQDEFYEMLNSRTHGNVETKIIKA